MTNTTKIIIGIIVLVLIGWGISSYKKQPQANSESIKIGAILPLSGDLADIGQEINRGALIAVDELQSQGIKVDYISEDDQFDFKKTASAAQKLTTIDKVDAVFTAIGEQAEPIAKIFNAAKVPLLVAWDSNNNLKKLGDYIFSTGFSSEGSGEKMADFAREKLGLSKVALVSHVDAVADIIVDAFVKKFSNFGGTVISKDRVSADTTDYRSVITKIKNEKADGVYTIFLPPANGLFAIQSKQLGLSVTIMAADAIQDSEISQAGSAIEGWYMHYMYTESPDKLTKLYEQKFGQGPASIVYASFGYDSVVVLAEAGKISKEKNIEIAEALRLVNTDKTSTPVNMNNSNFSERIEKIFKVENGKRVLIEK